MPSPPPSAPLPMGPPPLPSPQMAPVPVPSPPMVSAPMTSPPMASTEQPKRRAIFFRGSRPPSPSVIYGCGRLDLDDVDRKLLLHANRRPQSPRSPSPYRPLGRFRPRVLWSPDRSPESERNFVRKKYDELVELGGILPWPWAEHGPDDLTDAERGDDNGEFFLIGYWLDRYTDWEGQLRVWKRYMMRRAQDGLPDPRNVDRSDVVPHFVAYLRRHMLRDMKERAEPLVDGRKRWEALFFYEMARDLIAHMVQVLPVAEALLRRMRIDLGDANAEAEAEVTVDGIMEEYGIPKMETWRDEFNRLVDLEEAAAKTAAKATTAAPSDSHPGKRQREDDAADEARAPKRVASPGKVSLAESSQAAFAKSPGAGNSDSASPPPEQQAPAEPAQPDGLRVQQPQAPVATPGRPSCGGENDAQHRPTANGEGSIGHTGPRRSARVAVRRSAGRAKTV